MEQYRKKSLFIFILNRLDSFLGNNVPNPPKIKNDNDNNPSYSSDDDDDDLIDATILQAKLNIVNHIPHEWPDVKSYYDNIIQKYQPFYISHYDLKAMSRSGSTLKDPEYIMVIDN